MPRLTGFTQFCAGRWGSRLFTAAFVGIFLLILVELVIGLVTGG